MLSFDFKVNNSFLKTDRHPITIPRSKESQLEKERLDEREHLVIVCPDGSQISGYMYFYAGESTSKSSYYQIQARGYDGDPLYKLSAGQQLRVYIERINTGVVIKLRFDQNHYGG